MTLFPTRPAAELSGGADKTVTMYDTTYPAALPPQTAAAAGYVDGAWPSYFGIRRRFPHAIVLSIATDTRSSACVLDVEQGNGGPHTAAQWVQRAHARGVRRPALFCSRSRVASLLDELRRQDVHRGQVRLWVADWTPRRHIAVINLPPPDNEPPGATQYAHDLGLGYDVSVTTLGWLDAVVYDASRGAP